MVGALFLVWRCLLFIMAPQSDEHIMAIVHRDKDAGVRQLFNRYYRPLVLYADEYLKDLTAAEDVVQELFVKLWEEDYLSGMLNASPGPYLYSAVRNRCFSYIHQKDVLRGTKELENIDIPVEWVAGVDEERMERVMKEIDELPERTRQVVECVMLRGLKYREVAEEMGISVNTVKFLLKEGTKRLRERLAMWKADLLFFFIRKIFGE